MRRGLLAALALMVLVSSPACRRNPTPPKLTSVSMTLPDETEALPAGPHLDTVAANCTACHSAAMITTQPVLSADQWKAEVTKMREAYHAPVADADVPPILTYLDALSARRPAPGG